MNSNFSSPRAAIGSLLCGAFLFLPLISYGAAKEGQQEILEEIRSAALAEIQAGNITGVSVALIQNGEVVYAGGFGYSDKKKKTPAEGDTFYRVASISKLFNALSIMHASDQGKINIDAPIQTYVKSFHPINPFDAAEPITLRHLMTHRAGMFRECPVGNYFDPTEPSLADTIASLSQCALVFPPNTKTKYSNSGVALSGFALEQAVNTPFADYVAAKVLQPIGMGVSSFTLTDQIRKKLATGYVAVAQPNGGFREIEAPVFQFGMLPAANLYSSARELAKLGEFILKDATNVVKRETLQQMFTPQFTNDTNGYGLAFNVTHVRGNKDVSHMGEVYGFTSSIHVIPEKRVGAVVLCNDDIAEGPVRRLMTTILDTLLGEKKVERKRKDSPSDLLTSLEGDYESPALWATIEKKDRKLVATISRQKVELDYINDLEFSGNGRLHNDLKITFEKDASGKITHFNTLGQKFVCAKKLEAPPAFSHLVGSYGPKFIPFIVSIRHGHLYGMTENYLDYRLTPVTSTVFKMAPGMYSDEYVVFEKDRTGHAVLATLANMPLKRQ